VNTIEHPYRDLEPFNEKVKLDGSEKFLSGKQDKKKRKEIEH
jgi:hypothetical protein